MFRDKNGKIYFGRNFDFMTGLGHVQINLQDQKKMSFGLRTEKTFVWHSKYGSITFNQNGREFPYGGMNEAGLVVEQMMLGETKYPAQDERYGLTELQWIQYQLDVSATVEDVINSNKIVRVSYESQAPLHFLVSDAKGNCAVIEYINGEFVCYTGSDLKINALTNNTFVSSLDYKAACDAKDTGKIISDRYHSLNRFVTAANMIAGHNNSSANSVDYAFSVLKEIAQGKGTQWSIVYDATGKKIYYKTGANEQMREVNFNQFDFSGTAKKLYIDIDESKNKPADFKLFTYEDNLSLINNAWERIPFLKDLPKELRALWARAGVEMKYEK
jgi:choloylglycine hydrolase